MKLTSHTGRTKTLVPREPLRTHAECAELLRMTSPQLAVLLRTRNGPEPELHTYANYRSDLKYYRPSLMKKWWASVRDGADKPATAQVMCAQAAMEVVAQTLS